MAEKASKEGAIGSAEKEKTWSRTREIEEAMRRCLSENNGNQIKCRSKVEAIQSSSSSLSSSRRIPRKKLAPFRLKKGSIIDV